MMIVLISKYTSILLYKTIERKQSSHARLHQIVHRQIIKHNNVRYKEPPNNIRYREPPKNQIIQKKL